MFQGKKNAWITLNRSCNLRCNWCYAKSAGYGSFDNLQVERAINLVNIIADLKVSHISLIGGEPTVYENLASVVRYINSKNISSGLITNGVALASKDFLMKLCDAGLSSIGISLKGFSTESYKNNTGVDAYDSVLKAINNVVSCQIPYSVSMVLNSENIKFFLQGVEDAKRNGATNFYFTFEFDFSPLEQSNDTKFDFKGNVFDLVEGFYQTYDELCNLTNGNFVLHQTFPLCIWEDEFLNVLKSRNQIHTSCQLLQRTGIIFDTNGNLLPCNAMYNHPIGKYGFDFTNGEELKKYLSNNKICKVYERLSSAPSKKCVDCDKWELCGGGCISNWCHYDLDTLLSEFLKYKTQV